MESDVKYRAQILGVAVDRMTLDQCVDRLDQAVIERRRCHIVLVNAAKIVKCRFDPELAEIVRHADLIGADGVPVVWASRLLGRSLPGRVNGTDLMERLFRLCETKGHSVYLLGARPEVLARAVAAIREQYPGLRIAGSRHGYFGSAKDEQRAVRAIAESGADVLLVGMSTPMKEKWVHRHSRELAVPVIHGIGGSFDILAGVTRRAPLWMQRDGLEWFYRLCQEPRRMWKRYLVTNSIFVYLVIRELVRTRAMRL